MVKSWLKHTIKKSLKDRVVVMALLLRWTGTETNTASCAFTKYHGAATYGSRDQTLQDIYQMENADYSALWLLPLAAIMQYRN